MAAPTHPKDGLYTFKANASGKALHLVNNSDGELFVY